jgi:hypothetical protein
MGRETRDSHPISHMCHHTCLDKSFFLRTQALYRELPEKLTLFRLFTLKNALPYPLSPSGLSMMDSENVLSFFPAFDCIYYSIPSMTCQHRPYFLPVLTI